MSLEPFTDRQLTAAFFGWLSTGFGTWLLIPAWLSVLKGPPGPIEPETAVYFAAWLAGDVLHLSALVLERVGWQSYTLYIIIAAAEVIILATLMWKARLFRCCQKPLPLSFKTRKTVAAFAGYTLSMKPEGAERDPPQPTLGFSALFWKFFWTLFFVSVSIIVWYILAFKRIGGVGAPKASSWPHDTLSLVAFVFGCAGFFCWTGPRVYVLWTGIDRISTSSVVLGVAAHLCNIVNIATVNVVAFDTAAAASPFVLTSIACIILDGFRLRRTVKRQKEMSVRRARAQEEREKKREATSGEVLFGLTAAARDFGAIELGKGNAKQRKRADEAIADWNVKWRGQAEKLLEDLQKECRREKLSHGLSSAMEVDDSVWEELCERGHWDPTSGKPLKKENWNPKSGQPLPKGGWKTGWDSVGLQSRQTLQLVEGVYGRKSLRYINFAKLLERIEKAKNDLLKEREKRIVGQVTPPLSRGLFPTPSSSRLSKSTVTSKPSRPSQSLGHRSRHSLSSHSSFSSSDDSLNSDSYDSSEHEYSSDDGQHLMEERDPRRSGGGRGGRRW